jgi:hypothetical protein
VNYLPTHVLIVADKVDAQPGGHEQQQQQQSSSRRVLKRVLARLAADSGAQTYLSMLKAPQEGKSRSVDKQRRSCWRSDQTVFPPGKLCSSRFALTGTFVCSTINSLS